MVGSAACLWGTFSLFFKNAERIAEAEGHSVGPATESFVFFLIVLILLGPRSLKKKPIEAPTREAWIWLAFFSIADAANVLLYFAAMQHTSIAIAVLSHYIAPVFLALLAPVVLREPKMRGTWSAVFGALLGLTLLLEPHKATENTSWIGALMGAGSALLFAGAMMSMKRLGQWFHSDQVLCLHYPGALLVLFLAIPEGELAMGWKAWGLLSLAGLLPGTLGGLLFVEGIRRLPASRAGILTLLEPVVAVSLGLLVWGESPGILAAVGALIILGAAYRVMTLGESS